MKWNYDKATKPFPYGEQTSYKLGLAFLDGYGDIEDWGCGTAFANALITKSNYIGIDITPSVFVDKIVDLETYKSSVDCIFMRHVLEHNHNWDKILQNAVNSFKKRMVLVLFTPLVEVTHKLNDNPDYSFKLEDIVIYIANAQAKYTMEKINSQTQYGVEYLFYIEK